MHKLSDEYSLEDWRRFNPDTAYAMLCAHESARERELNSSLRKYVKADMEARQTPVFDTLLWYGVLGILVVFLPVLLLLSPLLLLGWLASFFVGSYKAPR